MDDLHLLDEIVEALEQDENLTRIKKLIVFMSHGYWIENEADLAVIELREAVQELIEVVPTLSTLKQLLHTHIKKLTKPETYAIVADTIVDSVGLLYAHMGKDTTAGSIAASPQPAVTAPTVAPTPVETAQPVLEQQPQYIPNPFDLRLEIANAVSPLRAKMLLFSALYYKFSAHDSDWAEFNARGLDDLLESLYQHCSTWEELEARLHGVAVQLEEPNEFRQAAAAIAQAMKSVYSDR